MVSIWVRTAFTTLIASDGSDDDAFLAAAKLSTSSMRTQTKAQGSSISSARESKLKKTILPSTAYSAHPGHG